MSTLQAPLTEQLWPPATFAQRGATVPATTPALSGTCARLGRRGLELVVPHPASPRGVYIREWAEVAESSQPTMHDTLLIERVARLRTLSPRHLKAAARAVAREGAAGRPARDAALAADERDEQRLRLTTLGIVRTLVTQLEGSECPLAELDRRGKAAVLTLAQSLGRAAAVITSDMEQLARVYGTIGLAETVEPGSCGHRLAMLDQLIASLVAWLDSGVGSADTTAALIVSAAETTRRLAQASQARATSRATDLPGLLRAMAASPAASEATLDELARSEWLLDGWEPICQVWRLARETSTTRAGLAEMAMMVPVLPTEAEPGGSAGASADERQRLRRSAQLFDEWRGGSAVFDLVIRNERLRALAT